MTNRPDSSAPGVESVINSTSRIDIVLPSDTSGEILLEEPEVRMYVLRHFQPDPRYREEVPLVMKEAISQASAAAGVIKDKVGDSDCVCLLGSGPSGRHQESQRLLAEKLSEEGMTFTDIRLRRGSLRNVQFGLLDEGMLAGNVIRNWSEQTTGLPEGVESWASVERRASKIIAGLSSYLLRARRENEVQGSVIAISFTSAEVILPYMRALISGIKDGQKILDRNPGSVFSLEPGDGFELRIKGEEVQIIFPAISESDPRVVITGKKREILRRIV